MNKVLGFLLMVAFATAARAQTPEADTLQGSKIEIRQADELEGDRRDGVEVRKVRGNVIFSHAGALMYCDSAFQYPGRNAIEAYGRVRVTQGDTLTLTGDTLVYDGDTQVARMRGRRVVMREPQMTLTTQKLNLDRRAHLAYYFEGGRIVDSATVLTSQQGYYDTQARYLRFKDSVVVRGQDPPYRLESDTLEYSPISKTAFFTAFTRITSNGRILEARRGTYQTVTSVARFAGGASVQNERYVLTGDSLYYDQATRYGEGWGNVVMTSRADSLVIEGDYGLLEGALGTARVFGNGLMRYCMGLADTLLVAADTLISTDRETDKNLIAYPDAKIFRSDLQGRCDSLVYNRVDSVIFFYDDPVLWNGGSQLEADSMRVQLRQNRIERMYLRVNAFIISQDSLRNYNQTKGRNMTAHFDERSDLARIDVDGNGQSIYFALERDSLLMGMNRIDCSNMVVRLTDNRVRNITFINKPDGKFIPPHELRGPDRRLPGFTWRIEERPRREDLRRSSAKNSTSAPATRLPLQKLPINP